MNSGLILNQPGFVLANARRLAHASAAAYSISTPPVPDTTALYSPETDTHVTVSYYDDCTVLAFRGTKDLANWLTDAEFLRERIPAGAVHRGFLAAADSVLPAILDCLAGSFRTIGVGTACPHIPPPLAPAEDVGTARPHPDGSGLSAPRPKTPLLLTGHSLGGALAVLCGYFLAEQDYPVHSIYTYGQPRVGDATFAAYYSEIVGGRTFRLVNQNDLVPRLPGWLLGYRHAGQLQFITELGQLVPDAPLWVMALSDALGLWQAWRRRKDVLLADHFIEQYIQRLEVADAETSNSKIQTSENPQTSKFKPRA